MCRGAAEAVQCEDIKCCRSTGLPLKEDFIFGANAYTSARVTKSAPHAELEYGLIGAETLPRLSRLALAKLDPTAVPGPRPEPKPLPMAGGTRGTGRH